MITATIGQMILNATAGPNNYDSTGTPLHTATKIINGYHVHVRITGWDSKRVVVWINRSSEPLTVTEAAERIAA